MRTHSQMLRAIAAHIGIIGGTITYVCIGAALFLYLERPIEIISRQYHLATYEKIKFAARIFEGYYLNNGMKEDQWNIASSILFAATTVIPVGYGFVTPITKLGRFIVIIYALIGAPMSVTGLCFLGFLIAYVFIGAILFSLFARITYLEAAYFSITSVFTIGYGDTHPPIPVPYLILYIIIGVILVTITVEVLAAEAIDHIHYMGRHVGKARKITRKVYKMARAMNVRRSFNTGLMQIESFIRLALIFGMMKTSGDKEAENVTSSYNINIPFTPTNDDITFADEDESKRILNVTVN
ncbi:unnamed protein product [Acanthocheilonema viteae]|uniref:Potassium channel domain-containing protein n=1 Tax=Acanthocheilonema viteae TaxID=6277 RepID=A0A498SEE6_ACAVI|nr:unnamed protein product [Acanthocheilonema viteae]